MNKQKLLITLFIATFSLTAFAVSNQQQEPIAKEAMSIAWYTANIREARKVNKECYDNPKLQSTEDCKNSLHALKISFVGTGN